VELGVEQRRDLAVAFSGQYEFTGDVLVAVHRRGPDPAKKQKGRASVQRSETHVNSVQGFLISYSKDRGPLGNLSITGAPRARFAWTWADLGWFQPTTVHHFSFSFSTRLR
jgi:hypothetical protein